MDYCWFSSYRSIIIWKLSKNFGLAIAIVICWSGTGLAQLPTLSPGLSPQVPLPPPPPPINPADLPQNPGLSQSETAYTLGAGDRIKIDFFNVPEYSKEYQILVDGSLNLPLVGTISLQDLTIPQATDLLSNRYTPFLTHPQVTVLLLGPRPLNIAIAGEVTRPGTYQINPAREALNGLQFPTLTQALELAKGVTPAANVQEIKIRRIQKGNIPQIITVNLAEFLRTADRSQDITLRDGDSIFVSTATQINPQEVTQRANATFAADINAPVNITIVGEVNHPGPYTVLTSNLRVTDPPNKLSLLDPNQSANSAAESLGGTPTVSRAIKLAGGIKPEADLRNIQVIRRPKAGANQILNVNLWKLLQTGDITQDILLQEGDSIIVAKADAVNVTENNQIADASFSPNVITINVVGGVIKPGAIQVPTNTGLIQGVIAAGGFSNPRSQKGNLELVRLNYNGTISRQVVPIDLSKGLNQQNNPVLHNNDVIIVAQSDPKSFNNTLGTLLNPFTGVLGVVKFLFGL